MYNKNFGLLLQLRLLFKSIKYINIIIKMINKIIPVKS